MSDQSNSTPESSTDAEVERILVSITYPSGEPQIARYDRKQAAVALIRWRDRCVAEAVETAKLEGAIEQLQKSKRYYGPPMYGGIDNRINRLKRELAALLPTTGEGEE